MTTIPLPVLIACLAVFALVGTFGLARFSLPGLVSQFAPELPHAWAWNAREKRFYFLACLAVGALLLVSLRNAHPALALTAPLGALAYFDARSRYLPDLLQLACLGVTLVALHLAPEAMATSGEAVVSLVILVGLRGFMSLYERLRGLEGMGLGDVKLLAWMGLWLAPQDLVLVLFVACIAALAAQGVRMIRTARLERHASFAFGPWIIAAFCIVLGIARG